MTPIWVEHLHEAIRSNRELLEQRIGITEKSLMKLMEDKQHEHERLFARVDVLQSYIDRMRGIGVLVVIAVPALISIVIAIWTHR